MGDLNNWTRGDRIGDFSVIRQLGEGWEGVVYLVRDRRDGQLRTLKLFKGANVMEDVLHTVRRWKRFRGIASVKQFIEFGVLERQRRVSERPWMLMEYVQGETLAEKLERGAIRNPALMVRQLQAALKPIHYRRLTIGDFDHGRNVVIERRTGRMVFVDFDAGERGHDPPDQDEDLEEILQLERLATSSARSEL